MNLRPLIVSVLVVLIAGTAGTAQDAAEAARIALRDVMTAIREGNFQKALPLSERAVELAETANDRALLARAMTELGRARWGRGQYDTALAAHARALALFKEVGELDGEAEVQMRIGETNYSLGKYDDALRQYDVALATNQRMPEPSRQRESLIRSNIGVVLRFLGRYNEAATAIEQSLAISRTVGNDAIIGQALVALGIVNRARAEYQKAIEAYTEAIAIRRKLGDKRGEAQALGNLGNVYNDLGEFEKAIESHTRSLTLAEEAGYTAQVGFSTHNLAAVLAQLGRESLPRYEQALAVWRKIDRQAEVARTLREVAIQRLEAHGDAVGARAALDEALTIAQRLKDAEAEAFVLLELGILEMTGGALPPALARFEEGLTIARRMGSPHLEFELLSQRGRARLLTGEREAGIADLRASITIVNDVRAGVTSDDAKIAFFDTRQIVFRDLAAALIAAGRPIEALEVAEAGRARAFADVLHSRLVRPKAADRQVLDELRAELAKSPAGNVATLERLRKQNDELASLVTADSAGIDEIRRTAARLNATLVEYLVTPKAILSWVVTPRGEVHTARADVEEAKLAASIRTLLDAFNAPEATAQGARVTSATLRQLHTLLIAPIQQWLPADAGVQVVIVPHGPLSQVPFAALEDAKGESLVVRHTVSVSPSASVFRYTAAKRRSAASRDRSVVFAAPVIPPDVGLPALPGSLDEGDRVSRRLSAFGPTLLSGPRATEQFAKTSLGDAAYVHFATHGLVSEIRPTDSSLVLTAGGSEDGYLRAAEIYGLQLSADLIVLSGCSTARGRMTGDGVFGLPRAFMYAGAPSVIASLWDVSDSATVFLMDRFYQELLQTRHKARALRAAQIAARQRYPNPALWAPFVLIGEPQ